MSRFFIGTCAGFMRHHIIHVITSCIALQALIRGRVHTVRGKGKSCFMVIRQGSATVQVSYEHQLSLMLPDFAKRHDLELGVCLTWEKQAKETTPLLHTRSGRGCSVRRSY